MPADVYNKMSIKLSNDVLNTAKEYTHTHCNVFISYEYSAQASGIIFTYVCMERDHKIVPFLDGARYIVASM